MKKWIIFMVLISNSLFSEDSPIVCAGKVPWLNEQFKNEDRHFYMASSVIGDIVVGDAQTIEIDKKNKIIKVWTTDFVSYKSQAEDIKKYGQKYLSLGYIKDFVVFDMANKKRKNLHSSSYTCEGNVIESSNISSDWNYIVPGSVGEQQLEVIKQKYGL